MAPTALASFRMRRPRPLGVLLRASYYRSVFGARQAAKLYVARVLGRRRINLRPPGINRPLICRPRESDRFTLCHVFAEKDAEVPLALEPRLIVDGGANVGYVSVYYANRYPDARIVAVEPDHANVELARENCAAYPQVELLQAGLWSHDTMLEIHDPGLGWRSWGLQTREARNAAGAAVEGISIATLLQRIGEDEIDILKLDIEGSEEQVFADGAADWLTRVGVLLVETHGEASKQAVEGAMEVASFTQLRTGHRLVFANPSRAQ
jgi:FkbM family methyltransferase